MRVNVHYTVMLVLYLTAGLLLATGAVRAQPSGQQVKQLEGVGLDQKLGATIPLDLTFKNIEGKEVRLGQFFEKGTPVILDLAYFDCPMLCPLMLQGLTRTLKGLSWTPGNQYEVLTVSFNYREGPELAREKKEIYVPQLGKVGAADGWHFLTGSREAIAALTEAVGFNFRWIHEKKQYAHPTALIFLSGEGKISRYLLGIGPPVLTPAKTRKALVEASNGEVGSVIDKAILYCFQYDPNSNSYVADAFAIMRLGGVLTLILLGGVLFYFWRREGGVKREGAHGPDG